MHTKAHQADMEHTGHASGHEHTGDMKRKTDEGKRKDDLLVVKAALDRDKEGGKYPARHEAHIGIIVIKTRLEHGIEGSRLKPLAKCQHQAVGRDERSLHQLCHARHARLAQGSRNLARPPYTHRDNSVVKQRLRVLRQVAVELLLSYL